MRRLIPAVTFVIVGGLLVGPPGCTLDPYCINCDNGGGRGPDGGASGDGARDATVDLDAILPDACLPHGAEICNGMDDDCDGETDEAPLADVGAPCGTEVGACTPGSTECVDGQIVCGNGAVNPEAESCDGVDNDCDGEADDGDPGGGALCGTDTGDCRRGVNVCQDGAIACMGGQGPVDELCDGRDNDCDGVIDQGNPEGGGPCGIDVGECAPGNLRCVGGVLQCRDAGIPTVERCDDFDNDCDGQTDEDFDLSTDPNHCGDCATSCAGMFAHAQPVCQGRQCRIAYCLSNYWDLDGSPANGCEYSCAFQGVEICNGADDDCDGTIDDGLAPPSGLCSQVGACAGASAVCGGTAGWRCAYPAAVSVDASGDIVPETNCDDTDNDCDGVADDTFPQKGQACSRGLGACTTTGRQVCNGSHDGLTCDAATPPAGSAEVCNGVDDDCNGTLDDGPASMDAFVPISGGGITGTVYMYRYEASRPDANASVQGVLAHRPCSAPGKLPWTNVTQPQAEALCLSIGARLCSEVEWRRACQTASATACQWSYASSCTTYSGATCNGDDYDTNAGQPGDQDGLVASGSLASCYANWGSAANRINDLSGNVKEWTQERSPGVNPLRGGAYNSTATGLTCGFDFLVADDDFQFNNVGFRCCRDTAP